MSAFCVTRLFILPVGYSHLTSLMFDSFLLSLLRNLNSLSLESKFCHLSGLFYVNRAQDVFAKIKLSLVGIDVGNPIWEKVDTCFFSCVRVA